MVFIIERLDKKTQGTETIISASDGENATTTMFL